MPGDRFDHAAVMKMGGFVMSLERPSYFSTTRNLCDQIVQIYPVIRTTNAQICVVLLFRTSNQTLGAASAAITTSQSMIEAISTITLVYGQPVQSVPRAAEQGGLGGL